MFERFTDGARNAVVLARMEALVLRHPYIGTEHLLLGLTLEQEGLAARVLASLGITAERVREQVVRIVSTANQVSSEQIPFTPHAKRVLELALREGLNFGTNQIATEHILLGLLGDEDGGAVGILIELEVDAETIRTQLLSRLVDLSSEPGLDTGRVARRDTRLISPGSVRWARTSICWRRRYAATWTATPIQAIFSSRSRVLPTRWLPRRLASLESIPPRCPERSNALAPRSPRSPRPTACFRSGFSR
jgi:hypothetical protein